MNVATQVRSALIVTVPSAQSASPPKPAKVEPGAAVAVRVTTVPWSYRVQSVPSTLQLVPGGFLVTLPEPVPREIDRQLALRDQA